jgi:hypothetical protein
MNETAPVRIAEPSRLSGRWPNSLAAWFHFPFMLAFGLATVVCLLISQRFDNPDLWWHLKVGQIIWVTHSIPATDTFSFTTNNHSWIAHEWLAQLSIYMAYHLGGYLGTMVWLSVLASLLFILVYILCYQYCGNALVAFIGGMCALFFGTVSLSIRPLILGHIFLVSELLLLELSSRNRRILWLLPPLFAVWVNCHGSFFFGMGILFIYWICSYASGRWGLVVAEPWEKERRKLLGVILAICAVALFCNPVGFRLLLYPLDALFHQSNGMNAVLEWLPPNLRGARGIGMIAAMMVVLLLPIVRRTDLHLRELLVVAIAFFLATQHLRLLFVFGIVVSPVLCRLMNPGRQDRRRREHPIINAMLMAGFLSAIVCTYPNDAGIQQQIATGNPVGAVDYIRRLHLSGPMLNQYDFGGYLIWTLPEQKVFIDGRADIYDWTGVFAEYRRWVNLDEDPQLLLDKYKIHLCLVSADAPAVQVMRHLQGWHIAYSDDVAVVFTR